MSTAINYIDGLDGLAAGIVGIAAAALLLYCERLDGAGAIGPENAGPLIAAATLGACLGFLPHNFHPAKIFMGDAGALLLGLLMAAATIAVGGNTDTPFSGQTFFFFAPLFIPLVILGVPIIDTAFSIVRRARRGGNVTVADKDHLHHRLMRLGHGQRRSVLILWAWTVLLSAIVLYPTYNRRRGDLSCRWRSPPPPSCSTRCSDPGVRSRPRQRALSGCQGAGLTPSQDRFARLRTLGRESAKVPRWPSERDGFACPALRVLDCEQFHKRPSRGGLEGPEVRNNGVRSLHQA